MPRRAGNKCTDAQIEAVRRYEASKQPLKLLPTPAEAERIKTHAKKRGQTVTKFVIESCDAMIARDNAFTNPPEQIMTKTKKDSV